MPPIPPPAKVVAASYPRRPGCLGAKTPVKPKFTKQQVAGRLKQIQRLYEDALINDEFLRPEGCGVRNPARGVKDLGTFSFLWKSSAPGVRKTRFVHYWRYRCLNHAG